MINQKINALDNKIKRFENKLIDTLAWWIPIRKWRDNFRNKFFDNFVGGIMALNFYILFVLDWI